MQTKELLTPNVNSEGTNISHNSNFIVNSLAKTITAMIALKLVSLGKWNFNEPI
ncbi:hypothetical protein [Epilithonimonas sp.]|uniref:hypothetical protein n=1 Tax=Epilithonimonas sp. TaxID=2894511 RepID=UPI00289A538C|nr:hypothetical protein [Epilithonimonas sp.]